MNNLPHIVTRDTGVQIVSLAAKKPGGPTLNNVICDIVWELCLGGNVPACWWWMFNCAGGGGVAFDRPGTGGVVVA